MNETTANPVVDTSAETPVVLTETLTPSYRLCSLDLETLGTRPGDCILSLGACLFSPSQGIYSEIYMTIDQESSRAAGFRAQKSTIEWWGRQDEKVRAEAFKGEYSIESALKQFQMWLPQMTLVYGNGANFDNALLSAAYRLMKMDTPWPFYHDRCYRTLSAMFLKERVERIGDFHNALHDAKTQAMRLLNMQKTTGFEFR